MRESCAMNGRVDATRTYLMRRLAASGAAGGVQACVQPWPLAPPRSDSAVTPMPPADTAAATVPPCRRGDCRGASDGPTVPPVCRPPAAADGRAAGWVLALRAAPPLDSVQKNDGPLEACATSRPCTSVTTTPATTGECHWRYAPRRMGRSFQCSAVSSLVLHLDRPPPLPTHPPPPPAPAKPPLHSLPHHTPPPIPNVALSGRPLGRLPMP